MDPSLQQAFKSMDPNAMAGTPPKDLFANALGAHADGQNSQSSLSPGNTSQVYKCSIMSALRSGNIMSSASF